MRARWRRLRFQALVNLYPPYLGAGVRVTRVADDFSRIDVRMGLHLWNQNYVGTQFGGSLFAMADPFFMIMLMELLGPGYAVWDKAGTIRFRKPGRGTVRARFEIPPERVEEIRRAADAGGKVEPTFHVAITDEQGEVVAEVEKLLSVKRKAGENAGRPGSSTGSTG
jgi:acyl-coenzyme A thioesterase PaaI-like protein